MRLKYGQVSCDGSGKVYTHPIVPRDWQETCECEKCRKPCMCDDLKKLFSDTEDYVQEIKDELGQPYPECGGRGEVPPPPGVQGQMICGFPCPTCNGGSDE